MLPPKAFLDAISQQAGRLFGGESPLPKAELEAQFKVLMQSAFSKLDLVSREPDPQDGRRVEVVLTAKAERLLEDLSAAHLEELRAMRPLLTRLLARIGEEPDQA